ncbi:hypothetical protein EUTSA_v10022076mg [Eutrema salsugineum]|uniref:S-protein homolog n=1 Tax=Eutrema salsugineum TaxID=72664 RepID=V4LWL4_EUTSA|nr:S-protein homolog 2 [Eutrema salsugineum]ESQ48224.1 hypothetical protein EUTSA_v10022076mg [Eutrema salsugineum]
MISLKQLIVLFIMTMFTSATISRAQTTTTVVMYNDLGGGLPLQYHCKSGDNDLGDRSMAPGGSCSFSFKPDIFGRTLFFCSFSWGTESHYFDIYVQKRDREFEKLGCTHCEWKIRKNGPCKRNKNTGMFDVCLPWKS